MKVTIVHANPSQRSIGKDIMLALTEHLYEKEIEFFVRDLYKLNFDPVLSKDDMKSFKEESIPEDIRREQKYIYDSDILIFIYPLWWGGMPAIMKGYIDRVFAHGFAYIVDENGVRPGLEGKKVINICSHGESAERYDKIGMYDALQKVFEEGIFKFSGIETEEHFYFQDPWNMSPEDIQNKIESVKDKLIEMVK